MQSTGLLDRYLQATLITDYQASRAAGTDLQTNSSTSATQYTHQRTISNVHQASDAVLASSGSIDGGVGQQQTWLGALADLKSKHVAAGQDPVHVASPTNSNLLPGDGSSTPKRRLKGLFRYMRQADAEALLEQKLQEEQEQQQQPIHAAPADRANGTVRIIAGNALLQAKLQRLQDSMDAKSYRQGLLQQLQTPTALFPPTSHCQQQPGGDCPVLSTNSNRMVGASQELLPGPGAPRHATSPASVGHRRVQHPTTCYSSAAAAVQHSTSSWPVRPADGYSATAAVVSQQPGRQQQQQQQHPRQQWQHLRELAEYEPPWRAAGVAAAADRHGRSSSSSLGAVYRRMERVQKRPWTSSSAVGSRQWGLDIGSLNEAEAHMAAGIGPSRGYITPSRAQSQQQQHQVHQQVPRPASAVAALEQSLSELALLRSKLTQQQQQPLPRQQQQQVHGQQSSHGQPACQQNTMCSVLQQEQKQLSHSTWLQEPQLGFASGTWLQDPSVDQVSGTRSGCAATNPVACLGPTSSHAGHITVDGLSGSLYPHGHSIPRLQSQQPELQSQQPGLHNSHHMQHCSPNTGYSRWDAWQQQIHRHAVAVVDAGNYCSYGVCRSRSVPRPVRAWDAIPLQQTPAVQAGMRNHTLRCSSSGRLTGQRQQHIKQQHQQEQQQQLRPKTTGGIMSSHQCQHGLRTGTQPLGLHNEVVGIVARGASSLTGDRSSMGPSSSAWLLSSPLQRTKQHAAAGAVRKNMSSTGAATVAAGAGSRAQAVAAALAGASSIQSVPAAAAQAVPMVSNPMTVVGKTAAAAAQLLQGLGPGQGQVRTLAISSHNGRGSSHSAAGAAARPYSSVYARQLSAVVGQPRSSAGSAVPGGAWAGGAQAPLTQQLMEYASQRHKPPHARRSSGFSGSSSSSDTSGSSPAARRPQVKLVSTAYAAALSRVQAAKAATLRRAGSGSDSDSD